jgi:hypothetical protein
VRYHRLARAAEMDRLLAQNPASAKADIPLRWQMRAFSTPLQEAGSLDATTRETWDAATGIMVTRTPPDDNEVRGARMKQILDSMREIEALPADDPNSAARIEAFRLQHNIGQWDPNNPRRKQQ